MMESELEPTEPNIENEDDSFTEQDKKRLNELQKIQTNSEFTKEERAEFLRLSDKLEREREGGLTAAQEQEYLKLTKAQTNNDNWTREMSDRLIKLEDIRGRGKKKMGF